MNVQTRLLLTTLDQPYNMKTLITFGCSWMFGAGANFQQGDSCEDYERKWDDPATSYQYGIRGRLVDYLGCAKHYNFSAVGVSNQNQFRLATEFFADLEDQSDLIVVWGITSTSRTELFDVSRNAMRHIRYADADRSTKWCMSDAMFTHCYSHENELALLSIQMKFWDRWFKINGIRNFWVDMFNHHDYTYDSPNLLFANDRPRDLLSKMSEAAQVDPQYHRSVWRKDSSRLDRLCQEGLLNPYSFHPSQKGYELCFELMCAGINQMS